VREDSDLVAQMTPNGEVVGDEHVGQVVVVLETQTSLSRRSNDQNLWMALGEVT